MVGLKQPRFRRGGSGLILMSMADFGYFFDYLEIRLKGRGTDVYTSFYQLRFGLKSFSKLAMIYAQTLLPFNLTPEQVFKQVFSIYREAVMSYGGHDRKSQNGATFHQAFRNEPVHFMSQNNTVFQLSLLNFLQKSYFRI